MIAYIFACVHAYTQHYTQRDIQAFRPPNPTRAAIYTNTCIVSGRQTRTEHPMRTWLDKCMQRYYYLPR